MYIKGKILLAGLGDLTDVKTIRKAVFQDEQGLSESLDFDKDDNSAIFALAYETENEKDVPVATGRLLFLGERFMIGRIATLKEYRKKGYGDFVVRILLDKAFSMGAKEVYVRAMESAVDFYKTIGFAETGKTETVLGTLRHEMVVRPTECKRKCHENK